MTMRYVTKTMVVVINAMVVTVTGGTRATKNNLRPGQNLGFIDRIHGNSVFGRPIYPDIFHQAAAYMYYIIKNHSFHDGNKRTGLATAVSFLNWNGIEFHPFDEQPTLDFVVSVAGGDGRPDEVIPRIAAWFVQLDRSRSDHV